MAKKNMVQLQNIHGNQEVVLLFQRTCAQRISETLKGRKLSDNHKDNIVKGMVGKVSHGEDSHMWKGDAIGYSGVHKWIRDQLGAPKLCEKL